MDELEDIDGIGLSDEEFDALAIDAALNSIFAQVVSEELIRIEDERDDKHWRIEADNLANDIRDQLQIYAERNIELEAYNRGLRPNFPRGVEQLKSAVDGGLEQFNRLCERLGIYVNEAASPSPVLGEPGGLPLDDLRNLRVMEAKRARL